jgi:hypothetical protein
LWTFQALEVRFIKISFISAVEKKIKAREKIFNDLMEQIKEREKFLNRMARDEDSLAKTFLRAAQAELEKELTSKKEYKVRRVTYCKWNSKNPLQITTLTLLEKLMQGV